MRGGWGRGRGGWGDGEGERGEKGRGGGGWRGITVAVCDAGQRSQRTLQDHTGLLSTTQLNTKQGDIENSIQRDVNSLGKDNGLVWYGLYRGKFLDVTGTEVLRVFLLAIHSHLY